MLKIIINTKKNKIIFLEIIYYILFFNVKA